MKLCVVMIKEKERLRLIKSNLFAVTNYLSMFLLVLQLWPCISSNWLWDSIFYKWGFLSTSNWYNSENNCDM